MTELKQRIENEIKSISKTTLSNVFSNLIKKVSVESDHFEHLL